MCPPPLHRVSKVAVTQLIERISILEDALKENNIPLPQILNDQKKPDPGGTSSSSLVYPQDSPWQALSPGPQRNEPQEPQNEQELNRERTLIDAFDGPTPSGEEGIDADLDQLSKRMGSLRVAEDGQLRYYGATSNMHILRSSKSPSESMPSRLGNYNSADYLVQAGVGHYVYPELEDHLIKLYLTWENPFIHVVDEEAFLEARGRVTMSPGLPKEEFPSYYSELLVNAM